MNGSDPGGELPASAITYLDSLIGEADRLGGQWRNRAYMGAIVVAIASFSVPGVLWYLLSRTPETPVVGPVAVTALLGLFILWSVVRSLWAIANAFALRAGHLEDVKLFVKLVGTDEPMRPTDVRRVLVELRRSFIAESVRQSVPDRIPAGGSLWKRGR